MEAMTISRLIARLERLKAEHGDLPVFYPGTDRFPFEVESAEVRPAYVWNYWWPDPYTVPDRVELG